MFLRLVSLAGLALCACHNGPQQEAQRDTAAAPAASAEVAPKVESASKFGAPISGEEIKLSVVAAAPERYKGKTIVTSGTIGSVCQHRGCWLTLSDDGGEAFVRMAGHAFLVPKDSAGKKARVQAVLEDAAEQEHTCGEGKGHDGCRAEAEKQGGKPLAKLELQATGVELL